MLIKARECEECPLSWEDRGLEDVDAGCCVSGDFEINKWCYIPKLICKVKRWLIDRAERKYWEEEGKRIDEYMNE